jgi:hypothetical protein
MMARIKACLELARKNVWGVLLLLYPFADQIISTVEGWMPALAPHLGANTFRYMGLAMVAAKVALQVVRGWRQPGARLANTERE